MKNIVLLLLFAFQSNLLCDELRTIECQIVPISTMEKLPALTHGDRPLSRPMKTTIQGTSLNWCGYVTIRNPLISSTHTVSHVSGAWNVPSIAAATNKAYSLIWLGMDGVNNNYLEQVGTGHNWGNGAQVNFAWFQMRPHHKFLIKDFPLNISDLINAEVRYVGDGYFKLLLKNLTQGVVFEVPKKYTRSSHAPRETADWVVEAPIGHHTVLPLANFTTTLIPSSQTITFIDSWAKISGVKGGIGFSEWTHAAMTMTAVDGTTVKASPSALNPSKTGFSATWVSQ